MASKVKALQEWCRIKCDGYRDVCVKNMTSSWKSGLAFCAIIHRYRPDLIDYDSLTPDNVFDNNKLAFTVAEEHLGIPALLDAEDMVAMTVPDKLCVVTYVSQYYNYFRNKTEEGGPGVKGKMAAKRQRPPPSMSPPPVTKRAHVSQDSKQPAPSASGPAPAKRSTLGDKCYICGERVFIMERHIEGSKLYHRRCIREHQRSNRSSGSSQIGKSFDNLHRPGKENEVPPPTSASTASSLISRLNGGPKPYGAPSVASPPSRIRAGEDKTDNTDGKSNLLNMLCGAPAGYGGAGRGASPASRGSPERVTRDERSSPSARPSRDVTNPVKTVSSTNVTKTERFSPVMSDVRSNRSPNMPPARTQSPLSFSANRSPGVSKPATDSADSGRVTQFTPAQPQIKQGPFASTYTPSPISTSSASSGANRPAGGQQSVLSGLLSSLADVRKRPTNSGDSIAKPAVVAAPESKPSQFGTKSPPMGSRFSPGSEASSLGDRPDRRGVTDRLSPPAQLKAAEETNKLSPRSPQRNARSPQNTGAYGRQHRPPSPKSILKPTTTEDSRPNPRAAAPKHVKLSSPFLDRERDREPKPILKQNGISPHRSRSSSPPRSILKSLEFPGEEEKLGSQPKSILKSKESLEEMEIDDGDEQRPRPILKGTRSHSADGVEGLLGNHGNGGDARHRSHVRSILKQSIDSDPDLRYDSDSRPKSILKSSHENLAKDTDPGRKSSDSDDDILTSFVDELRMKGVRPDPVKGGSPQSTLSASPPKSILKKKSPEQKPSLGGSGPVLAKSVWQAPLPKSSGMPQVSSSFSTNRSRSSSDQAPESANNFSAFNLNDSFSLTGERNAEESSPPKSAWQIEMEARQGVRPKAPNLGDQLAKQMEEARARKAGNSGPTVPSSGHAAQPDKRPEWQLEAERRQAARKGKYDDPELQKSKSPVTSQDTSPRQEKCLSSPSVLDGPESRNLNSRVGPSVPAANPLAPPRRGKTEAVRPKSYNAQPPKSAPAIPSYPSPAQITSSPGKPGGLPSYGGMDLASIISKQMGRGKKPSLPPPTSPPPPVPQRTPPRERSDPKAGLSRSPAFRLPSPDGSPSVSDQETKERSNSSSSGSSDSDASRSPRYDDNSAGFRPINSQPGHQGAVQRRLIPAQEEYQSIDYSSSVYKRKVTPEVAFSFRSRDFDLDTVDGVSGYDRMQSRPLPSPPGLDQATPKRRVNAEARVATNHIMVQLEQLDQDLRQLEYEGRLLEEKIRQESDDAMDDGEQMIQWFELINKKNELVRKESEFMYKQRAQELEDLHEELEYEFRILMETPAHEKTSSDKIREEALLQEILETVTLRNHIVDCMEEDRLRYIEEDREIASMMSIKGLTNDPVKNKKKKKKDKGKKGFGKNKNSNDDNKDKKKDRKFFKIGIGSGGK